MEHTLIFSIRNCPTKLVSLLHKQIISMINFFSVNALYSRFKDTLVILHFYEIFFVSDIPESKK